MGSDSAPCAVTVALVSMLVSMSKRLFSSYLIGLSSFVLMHTVSSFGICQGMSWQHLDQPCVAG